MKRYVSLAVLIVIFGVSLLSAGSFFSSKKNSVGIRKYSTSVRGFGMGGTGLALKDTVMINNYSISMWRHLTETRATFSMNYNRISADIAGESYSSATGDFGGMNLVIPVKKKKVVVGIVLQPYTDLDFSTFRSVDNGGLLYDQLTELNGSVSRARVNIAWSLMPELGVAFQGSYYFGTLNHTYEFFFDDPALADQFHQIAYRLSGPGVGASFDAMPFDRLHVAGFADIQPNIDFTVEFVSRVPTPVNQERQFDSFPLQYGIGAAFDISKRWLVSSDYSFQKWSELLKTASPDYEDWYQLGIGFERRANTRRGASFFNRMDLRAGYSTSHIGYRFNDASVVENAVHLGMGLPFTQDRNRLDIGVRAGIRGDQGKNLAEETFFQLQMSISLGERWFQKFR